MFSVDGLFSWTTSAASEKNPFMTTQSRRAVMPAKVAGLKLDALGKGFGACNRP